MNFHDDTYVYPGKYTGTYSGSIKNEKIDIILYDESLNISVTMKKPGDGDIIRVPGGCNLTYYDHNENQKLDLSDMLILLGGAPGDKVTVIYRSNGNTVALYTIR